MSNQNPKLNLEFNIEDIPWLFHSLSLQVGTTMCYGRVADKTKERVKEYVAKLKEFYPLLANHDIEEYVFFNAISHLYTCKTWSLYQKKPRYKYELKRWREPIVMTCDDKVYELTSFMSSYNEKCVTGLLELCKQISPIEAEYTEHPSIQQEIQDNPSWYNEDRHD